MADSLKKFAFVLMPFSSEFDDVYRLGIKEPAAALGIRAERVDEQIYKEGILDRIYRQIEAADLIIADMTSQNPNVFYEVGYAHAKDKFCILLTKDASDIPFDLKHKRHIVYGGSIQYLRETLTNDLQWTLSQIESVSRSRIRISSKSISGDLELTKFTATANITFLIDLHNDSEIPSAEIDTIYFYTGNEWAVYQDGSICPSTDSDVPAYKHRYFLTPPVKRLQKSGWAQLRFTAKRIIARTYHGEELKESYPITGQAAIRMGTDMGIVDYQIQIDTTADWSPF